MEWFESVFPCRVSVSISELLISEFNFGFVVRSQGSRVGSGIEQRDAAVIVGAKQAVVFIVKQGVLYWVDLWVNLGLTCFKSWCLFLKLGINWV